MGLRWNLPLDPEPGTQLLGQQLPGAGRLSTHLLELPKGYKLHNGHKLHDVSGCRLAPRAVQDTGGPAPSRACVSVKPALLTRAMITDVGRWEVCTMASRVLAILLTTISRM